MQNIAAFINRTFIIYYHYQTKACSHKITFNKLTKVTKNNPRVGDLFFVNLILNKSKKKTSKKHCESLLSWASHIYIFFKTVHLFIPAKGSRLSPHGGFSLLLTHGSTCIENCIVFCLTGLAAVCLCILCMFSFLKQKALLYGNFFFINKSILTKKKQRLCRLFCFNDLYQASLVVAQHLSWCWAAKLGEEPWKYFCINNLSLLFPASRYLVCSSLSDKVQVFSCFRVFLWEMYQRERLQDVSNDFKMSAASWRQGSVFLSCALTAPPTLCLLLCSHHTYMDLIIFFFHSTTHSSLSPPTTPLIILLFQVRLSFIPSNLVVLSSGILQKSQHARMLSHDRRGGKGVCIHDLPGYV